MKEIRRVVGEMVVKLDNAHYDIRRHESELRALRLDCAPMLHGHPSIRRRIKNAFQPQINALKEEVRTLKAQKSGSNQWQSMIQSPDNGVREKVRQLERKVADIESGVRSRDEHAISKEEFIAQKMITAQQLKNVQEDFSPLVEKITGLTEKIDELEDNDKKLVEKFSGVLDNVITSVDAKMHLLTGFKFLDVLLLHSV